MAQRRNVVHPVVLACPVWRWQAKRSLNVANVIAGGQFRCPEQFFRRWVERRRPQCAPVVSIRSAAAAGGKPLPNGWRMIYIGGVMPSKTPPEQMMFQLSLRRRGISDQAVLRTMEEVPREVFVEAIDRADAYRDSALAIACGQTISQPFVVAYMTEQLQLQKSHRVLEIGAGSGYQAAILSRLAKTVLTIERFRTLADTARQRLEKLGYYNVEVMFGDGFAVPPGAGQFDRIIVTAAMEAIPQDLLDRLEPNGFLIAPVGPPHGVQTLVRVVRTADGFDRKELVDVRFVPAIPGIAREL
jgi:protein-L-isoaspartate(D-aspartate) O-methyltransferase